MCLKIDLEKHPDLMPFVAEEDILCYKRLLMFKRETDEYLCSPVYAHSWFVDDVPSMQEIVPGKTLNYLGGGEYNSIEAGYHAYMNLKPENEIPAYGTYGSTYGYFQMVIPKGTKYFLGHDDEIVAEQMMLISAAPILENINVFKD